jgi:formylglycine-generating enzyme required for sulfatase activity
VALLSLILVGPAARAEPGPAMITIPGGTFLMGATDGQPDEQPVTRVTLSRFSIDRTEVTVAAYRACVEAGKCTVPAIVGECNWGKTGRDNHPINCIDWYQATTFCGTRGARLPTEAEWEFAARGKDGRKYPWGNAEPDASRGHWNATEGTGPVGQHPAGASPFGVQDMAGNVWEWVENTYEGYVGGSLTNPHHPPTAQAAQPYPNQVYGLSRGGGWSTPFAARLRAARRTTVNFLANRFNYLGFRCARGSDQ